MNHQSNIPTNMPNPSPSSRLSLAALFQDGAVLQRDMPLTIWGWGPPACRVRVTLAGQTGIGWVSTYGDFRVELPPLPAGGPHCLRVELPDVSEVSPLEVGDLYIGEVWLASGQSNMAMTLAECAEFGVESVRSAMDSLLRIFTVEQRAELAPQRNVTGCWQSATPETSLTFSAVAFYFAYVLRRELDVPVGVIVSAWGGTPIESWLSRQAHARSPHLAVTTADYHRYAHSEMRWACLDVEAGGNLVPTRPADPGITPESEAWAKPDFDDSAWPLMSLPSTWQKHGHAFSGVFWFRRTISVPEAWRGRDLVVELGAIDKQDITFANGIEIGRMGAGLEEHHWNQLRRYKIPAAYTSTSTIVFAVRVYSFIYDGGLLGPVSSMRLLCAELPSAAPLPLDGDWHYAIEHNFGYVPVDHDPGHLIPQSPHILFDNMIAPISSFALRGALWYQGERNTAHPERYADLLRDLIDDWRRVWAQGDFPFFIVQLPSHLLPSPHQPDSNWARLRNSQLHVSQTMQEVTTVVTLDVGDADDIHPRNKKPVGERLAQAALVNIHGCSGAATGPMPIGANLVGKEVRVNFDLGNTELHTTDGKSPTSVYLCDANRGWHSADTRIEAGQLIASSATCSQPVEISYAWADNPIAANLANSDGHPASPFRLLVRF